MSKLYDIRKMTTELLKKVMTYDKWLTKFCFCLNQIKLFSIEIFDVVEYYSIASKFNMF